MHESNRSRHYARKKLQETRPRAARRARVGRRVAGSSCSQGPRGRAAPDIYLKCPASPRARSAPGAAVPRPRSGGVWPPTTLHTRARRWRPRSLDRLVRSTPRSRRCARGGRATKQRSGPASENCVMHSSPCGRAANARLKAQRLLERAGHELKR